LPFASYCYNLKLIFEKNVIIFFEIKNYTNGKELINSYNLIHSKKGIILLIKNSLDNNTIYTIENDNNGKALFSNGLNYIYFEKFYIIYSIFFVK
jgi:hypothetical protein